MATRRMLKISIIDSDLFLDMPKTTQCLYFHLCMRADDDWFIDAPKKIMRIVGCNEDDLKLLIAKQFILPFESGVIVIKHWKLHNTIRKDVYKETEYLKEKNELFISKNGEYLTQNEVEVNQLATNCNETVTEPSRNRHEVVTLGKDSIGKVSKVKDSISKDNKYAPNDLENRSVLVLLPLKDGTDYEVTQDDVNKYIEAYPNVDVMTELNKMKLWLESNPPKRKTQRGINKFIVGWLNRQQPTEKKEDFAF